MLDKLDFNIDDGKLFEISNNYFNPMFDKVFSLPVIFTLIVLFQGNFGGMGVSQTPAILERLAANWITRAIFCIAIAYTATSDLETAIFSTLLFYVILHFLRTKEEREKMDHFI